MLERHHLHLERILLGSTPLLFIALDTGPIIHGLHLRFG